LVPEWVAPGPPPARSTSPTAAAQGAYSPFDEPFFLSLNQAMGAIGNQYDASTVPERVTTQIDYVRIWK
jgi:hypothetical protein